MLDCSEQKKLFKKIRNLKLSLRNGMEIKNLKKVVILKQKYDLKKIKYENTDFKAIAKCKFVELLPV